MVGEAPVTVGIDRRSGLYYVARIRHQAGRPEVKALARFEYRHIRGHYLLRDATQVLAVPDDRVTVKDLQVDTAGPFDGAALAKFECTQAVLDPESDFCFDWLATDKEGRGLGLTVRKSSLVDLSAVLAPTPPEPVPGLKFQLRATGLGRGYLEFCRRETGDFYCLVDFTDELASICYIFYGRIIGVGYLDTRHFDLSKQSGLEQMAVELKMVVNFRLAAFMEQEISVPLSGLIATGEAINEEARGILRKYFPVGVHAPRISPAYFPNQEKMAHIPLDKYLVALGLAVEK